MLTRARTLSLLLPLAAVLAEPASAERVTVHAALLRDLSSVIEVLGLPCGGVLGAARRGENDHIASCRNGIRYRVHVNANGRVVALKR